MSANEYYKGASDNTRAPNYPPQSYQQQGGYHDYQQQGGYPQQGGYQQGGYPQHGYPQQGYHQQQQPVYVQQQQPNSGSSGCCAGILAGLCFCCALDMCF
ncbi:hypothetical protein NADFUDRAFT_65793 [Nadsonia fulvescens var. elongata DSM 6958]|uniref:Cysteine-rich transmembrane domain-containing protein n=1 Tax=Nadsonia fulvescens var. elongata DSM 6958 TaxID=857566 RepID=A0A1E3PKJ8_9ASCO|nr:hypothetical protein NADFUDRAFT_65793 [Nadsonia fulvescens var. elongata DSM 6958]